jgi:hypothetical protein
LTEFVNFAKWPMVQTRSSIASDSPQTRHERAARFVC